MSENTSEILQDTIWEGQDLAVMSRIQDVDANNITQASIDSIALSVFDKADNSQVGSTTALTVADVIFDTLQTGSGWLDATGFNFRYVLLGSTWFPDGDKQYRIEIIFSPAEGSPFPLVLDVSTQNLLSN